jgi:RNA polymerase sigma-70 factor (ECF subfamily)
MDEAQLLERCKNGDKEAFSLLLGSHRRIIEGTAFGLLKNREAVKEVIQEVFIRVFKRFHTFNGECRLSTWIYRITFNESMRYLQKEKNRAQTPLDLVDEIPAADATALQGLLLREQKTIMKTCISELPPDFREAVMLHYFEDMKLEDIAVKLNLPQGTVHSRIGRAREILKEKIKAYAV